MAANVSCRIGATRRRTALIDQQRATQNRIKRFWSVEHKDGARGGTSTRCADQITPTVGGTADPAERGVEKAKAVGRYRFTPPLLNALSSFTVEPTPRRRTGTESLFNCIGPETGPAEIATASGCTTSALDSVRRAPKPSTAARSASAATMVDAHCRRDHREGIPTPKLTVVPTVPAAKFHPTPSDTFQDDLNFASGSQLAHPTTGDTSFPALTVTPCNSMSRMLNRIQCAQVVFESNRSRHGLWTKATRRMNSVDSQSIWNVAADLVACCSVLPGTLCECRMARDRR